MNIYDLAFNFGKAIPFVFVAASIFRYLIIGFGDEHALLHPESPRMAALSFLLLALAGTLVTTISATFLWTLVALGGLGQLGPAVCCVALLGFTLAMLESTAGFLFLSWWHIRCIFRK